MTISANYPTVAPTLNLDFANSQSLDPRINFQRGTTGTYYDGETSALAEQNFFQRSQEFDNAYWIKYQTTVTANSVVAPDGTTTAETIIESNANDYHTVYTAISLATSTVYTLSAFLKANTRSYGMLGVGGGGLSIGYYAKFDLTNGTATNIVGTGFTSNATSVGNGWYRCTLTFTSGTSASHNLQFGPHDNGSNPIYAGDGTSSVYLWGAQVEQRSAVGPYQVTTTAAITNYIPQLLTAVANQPRFDFNPVTRQSLGLLMEQSSVNKILQSEDFSTTWSATRATVSTNINIAPSGALTADTIVANTDNNTHFVSQTFTGTAASHTFTVYAKAYGLNHVALRLFNGATQVGLAYYNLSTGATGTVTAGTATITSVGNGWYRCALTATLAASASCTADIQLANADNTNSFVGNDVSGVYVWGAQIEATAFPTSYISTGVSEGTRAQDFATMTGTNFSSWFNNQQGTVYCSFDVATISSSTPTAFWGIDNNSSIGYFLYRNSGFLQPYIANAQANIGAITANTTQQSSFTYNNSVSPMTGSGSLNGATAVSISSPVQLSYVPTQLSLGKYQSNSAPLTGHIRKFAYYPVATTATNLQALTGS